MKKLFLTLLLPAGLAHGQQLKLENLPAFGNDNQFGTHSTFHKDPGQLLVEDSRTDKIMDLFKGHTNPFSQGTVLSGKFSHWAQDGSAVYKINPDNMPCVVPPTDRLEKMPVIRLGRGDAIEHMPNVSPRIELIPKDAEK